MSNVFSIDYSGVTSNANIATAQAQNPTGGTLNIPNTDYPDGIVVYSTFGGIATAGPSNANGAFLALASVDHPSDNQSITAEVAPFTGYVTNGESTFAYGDAGPVARVQYVTDYGNGKLHNRYRAYMRFKDQTLQVDRINVNTSTPGLPGEDVTSLYSAALASPLVVGTNRFLTLEVSGTNPVIIDVKEAGVSLLTAPIQDSSSLRVTTGKKFGQYIRAANGNAPGIGSLSADTLAAAVTPVSFSGPIPTRNGIIGTAASFANAGFFAGTGTPFAYTNVGAALPAGLTLSSSTGIISGTPTTAATTSGIIIRATDTASNVANTNSYSIVIAATNASPTFPGNISNISGNNGSAITPVNVSGQFSDTDTLTYSASPAGTAWPTGLVVNSSTGIISGTSSTTATTTGCKVRATDTGANTVDSNAFNFVIAAASSNPTFAASGQLKSLNGGILPNGSYSVIIRSKTNLTAAPLAVKTSVTLTSGVIPSFAIAGPTAGTEYVYEPVNEADTTIRGLARSTPT